MIKEGVLIGERYEIMGRIGTGGMADVYKGRDHKLNRYVALKVLKREFREDELFVKKFQSEAQAAAGLMHPNIVNVYDVGEDRGLYFMVMELVEGITLKEYIQKKVRLTPKEVISITLQVCAGIEAAHNNGIIHRDIKPQILGLRRLRHRIRLVPMRWDLYIIHLRNRHEVDSVISEVISIRLVSRCLR